MKEDRGLEHLQSHSRRGQNLCEMVDFVIIQLQNYRILCFEAQIGRLKFGLREIDHVFLLGFEVERIGQIE